MSSFSTLSGLFTYVEKSIEEVLNNEVSTKGKELLKKSMQEKIYSRPVNSYPRTEELLNSSDSSFESHGNIKLLNIFNNTSGSFMPSGHPSWVDGSNQNENIPLWLEFGNGDAIYPYSGTGYFAFMVERLRTQLKPTIIKGLKKRGIDAI